ncbi:MAG: hypothetical protein ACP5H2_10510 [Solirubrobacteraceae bacterium]
MTTRTDNRYTLLRGHHGALVKPYEAAGIPEASRSTLRDYYAMADIPAERLDEVLAEAKAEGS